MRTRFLIVFSTVWSTIAVAQECVTVQPVSGAGCQNIVQYSPVSGVTHDAAVLTDPIGEQRALFDLAWGGALASLTYNGTELLSAASTSAMVQPILRSGTFQPTQGGDPTTGTQVLGVQCAPDLLWSLSGMLDYGHGISGASPAFAVKNGQLVFTALIAHYTVTTYAHFVPNPAGSPAYYLRLDQAITNLSTTARTFALDLSASLNSTFTVTRQSPASCTEATPCAPSTVALIGGAYTSENAQTGLALAVHPAVHWASDAGGVAVLQQTSPRRVRLTATGWVLPALQARTYSFLAMAGNWENALAYASSPCNATVATGPQRLVPSTGRTDVLTVNAPSGCAWRASTDANWMTITTGATGTGNGSTTLAIAPNTDTSIRAGHVYVDGQIFPIAQSAAALAGPSALVATRASTTAATISWTSSAGASTYELFRGTTNANLAAISTNATTPFTDTTLAPGITYLYKVRAVNGGQFSAFSNTDLTTTVLFSNDPLVPGVTTIASAHLSELRQAVNAVRAAAVLAPGTYTDAPPTAGSTVIKATHIDELRAQLTAALSALGFAAPSLTDPTLVAQSTTVKSVHVQDSAPRPNSNVQWRLRPTATHAPSESTCTRSM